MTDEDRSSPVLPPERRPPWDQLKGMPASRVSRRRPILVAHRGASGAAPENTLAAFEAAATSGADGVEFDVQRTHDGHLVVFHDDDVDRVSDGRGRLADMTLDQLRALDVGAWFAPEFRGERIPTLRETFDLLRRTDLLLMIELKAPWRYPGMEAQVAALVREYGLVERTQVRSFYHAALHEMLRVAPEIALSELWWERIPGDDEVTYKTINCLYALYTPENVAQIHRRGQQATAWTVDDLGVARRLAGMGIDGLTTNVPERLLALWDE